MNKKTSKKPLGRKTLPKREKFVIYECSVCRFRCLGKYPCYNCGNKMILVPSNRTYEQGKKDKLFSANAYGKSLIKKERLKERLATLEEDLKRFNRYRFDDLQIHSGFLRNMALNYLRDLEQQIADTKKELSK